VNGQHRRPPPVFALVLGDRPCFRWARHRREPPTRWTPRWFSISIQRTSRGYNPKPDLDGASDKIRAGASLLPKVQRKKKKRKKKNKARTSRVRAPNPALICSWQSHRPATTRRRSDLENDGAQKRAVGPSGSASAGPQNPLGAGSQVPSSQRVRFRSASTGTHGNRGLFPAGTKTNRGPLLATGCVPVGSAPRASPHSSLPRAFPTTLPRGSVDLERRARRPHSVLCSELERPRNHEPSRVEDAGGPCQKKKKLMSETPAFRSRRNGQVKSQSTNVYGRDRRLARRRPRGPARPSGRSPPRGRPSSVRGRARTVGPRDKQPLAGRAFFFFLPNRRVVR